PRDRARLHADHVFVAQRDRAGIREHTEVGPEQQLVSEATLPRGGQPKRLGVSASKTRESCSLLGSIWTICPAPVPMRLPVLTGTSRSGAKIAGRRCDLFEFENGKRSRKDSYWKIVDLLDPPTAGKIVKE